MDMGAFYFSQFISDFTVDLTSGFVPLDVQFTNNSYPNTTNWAWDFDNDGEIDSYEQNPSYTYTQSEIYTVSLLVSDGINEAVEIKENYISVYSADLIITEIMQNPYTVIDNQGEWFEIFNAGDMYVDLIGCIIKDNGTDNHTIDSSIYIDPGYYYVLGNNANYETNGGADIGYEYENNSFGNGSDEILFISPQGNIIDSVGWDNGSSFPDPTGASMALFDPDLDNSIGSNWIVSDTPFGDGDLGSPGIPNFNPTILTSDEEIIFTDVMVGLTDTFNLVITNSGNNGLVIDSMYFDSDVFSSGINDTIVQMGNSISLSIYFTPQEVTTYNATIFIETNDYTN
jgi:PKD repeat protein